MTKSVRLPVGGHDNSPIPVPALDFDNAQQISLAGGVEQTINLTAGVYFLVGSADFTYVVGASAIAGTIRAPGAAGAYVPLHVIQNAPVALRSAVASTLTVFPVIYG